MSKAYEKAGVNLHSGYESVDRIKKHIEKTARLGMMGGIGSFGGMFDLSLLSVKEPVLVSGTDGVGTKLLIAQMLNKHDTIGEDAVAMCVNDVLAQGAEPIFFLDYIACGKIIPEKVEQIVFGVSNGCIKANCALIGGETAEMPDLYTPNEYDLAGFAVGIAEKKQLLNSSKVKQGDILIGISSSGIHSNGYSLVRKILIKDHTIDWDKQIDGIPLHKLLIEPTKIYVRPVLKTLKQTEVHAIAHITGGGFDENIPRVLGPGLGVEIYESRIPKQGIFSYLESVGGINHREMYNVFNMGIGMILFVPSDAVNSVLGILKEEGETANPIGKVIEGSGVVIL